MSHFSLKCNRPPSWISGELLPRGR